MKDAVKTLVFILSLFSRIYAEQVVDPSTLTGKVLCGYQGWFAAPGDGSERGWVHYGVGRKGFQPGMCTIDLWPDMSDYSEEEKYPTSFRYADGSQASVFSSYHPKTVDRHFLWMKQYGIDGVFLQRFGSSLRAPKVRNHRDVVTANVRTAAEKHGRVWAMMYDLSGLREGEIEKVVMADWKRLIDESKITQDRTYLHHEGKPVIAIWGIGFGDNRKYTLEECEKLIRFLKQDPTYGGNTLMLGIPSFWRTFKRDSVKDEKLHTLLEQADILSPWTVGRYRTPAQAKMHAREVVEPDIKWAESKGLEVLPVIFPGFSWQNLKKSKGEEAPLNHIPRLKGQFLWSQAKAYREAGASMLYVAMFDEIDEGTAIFKCTNHPPIGESNFLTYEGLPSDHYLWITGRITHLLRLNQKMPERLPKR